MDTQTFVAVRLRLLNASFVLVLVCAFSQNAAAKEILSTLVQAAGKTSAALDTKLLSLTGANVTNLSLKIRISGFNLSTFGLLEQMRFTSDLRNATSGVHKVYITDLAAGSVIVTAAVVIDTKSIPAFARALADNTALSTSFYGFTFLDTCGNIPQGDALAAIVQSVAGDLCAIDCPYSYFGQRVCGSCCSRTGQVCPAYSSPPNGCGSDNSPLGPLGSTGFVGFLIDFFGAEGFGPDGISTFFNPVCYNHDLCYATPFSDQSTCDTNLRDELFTACRRVYNSIEPGSTLCSNYLSYRLQSCINDAGLVYTALSVFGEGAYTSGQAAAIPYAAQDCLNTAISPPLNKKDLPQCNPPAPPPPPPSPGSGPPGGDGTGGLGSSAPGPCPPGNKKGAVHIADTDTTNPTGTFTDDEITAAIRDALGPEVSVLHRITTGGTDNSPTSSSETEDMVQISFPPTQTDTIAAVIASNSSRLVQNRITAVSITPSPCFASKSGFCAPGFVCCNQPDVKCCPSSAKYWLQPATALSTLPASPNVASVEGPGQNGAAPADTDVAVGPGHVVMVLNNAIDIRAKNSLSTVAFYQSTYDFFNQGTGTVFSSGLTDPQVLWDPSSQRFVYMVLQIVATTQQFASAILVAVSKTVNPLEGWHFMVIPAARNYEDKTNCFPDYPSMAASKNKLTISTNIACLNTATGSIRVAGTAFWVVAKNVPGLGSVYNQDVPAAVENVHFEFVDQNRKIFYIGQNSAFIPARLVGAAERFTGQFIVGIRTITGFYISYMDDSTSFPAPNSTYYNGFIQYPNNVGLGFAPDFPAGPDAPQKGSTDGLDTALFTAASSLKTAVLQNGKMYTTFIKDDPLRVYYAIFNLQDAVLSNQTGFNPYNPEQRTIDGIFLESLGRIDSSSLGNVTTFYPAITVNADGLAGIGFSASGKDLYPGAYFTCINPLTNRSSEILEVKAGENAVVHCDFGGSLGLPRCRWGDYSGAAIDPDGKTFWIYNSYGQQNNAIGTWLAAFQCSAPQVTSGRRLTAQKFLALQEAGEQGDDGEEEENEEFATGIPRSDGYYHGGPIVQLVLPPKDSDNTPC